MNIRSAIILSCISFAASTATAFASVELKGTFTPNNEETLINQLARLGYVECNSYKLNSDGSAVINAYNGQLAIEPVTTITIDKTGKASATEDTKFN